MKTNKDKLTEDNEPIKTYAFLEKYKSSLLSEHEDSKPNNLKTYDDVMADVYEAIRTRLGDTHLVLKLKEKGYHPLQKWANGKVGDWEPLNKNMYRIQITDPDEWGEYPKAWVIDVEIQKIYEH